MTPITLTHRIDIIFLDYIQIIFYEVAAEGASLYRAAVIAECQSLKNKANKALQLTPSRDAPISHDRSVFPFTSFSELVRPFGVAELGVRL